MVTFRPAKDLAKAARLTLMNMRAYYEQYAVDWDEAQIDEMTERTVTISEIETLGILCDANDTTCLNQYF